MDLDRNNRFLYKEKGDVLSNLERYEEALDDYEEAITLDPSYVHAYLDKSNVLKKLAKQKYDRLMQLAAQAYEQAKKLMQ